MKLVYGLLALLGTILPYGFFLVHFQAEGLGLGAFVQAGFANGVAGGLTADLLISSLVFWIWLFRDKGEKPWVFVLLNLGIGLSCALPAYLFVRESARDRSLVRR